VDLEKTLLRKVGEAIGKYKMIRQGDRVAVGLSGGKDSVSLLKALLLLQKRAPIQFSVCAFTVEQGKFLASVKPVGEFFQSQGVEWVYYRDEASFDLLEEQPDHGCDMCSRYRRRAVFQIAKEMGANVVALGHTMDDLCESFLRSAMYNGRLSALPPVTWSKQRDFRIIRPLVFVSEEITKAYAGGLATPVVPCGCSQKTGTVRRNLRDIFSELELEHPNLKETMISALGNLQPERLLDTRFLDLNGDGGPLQSFEKPELLPVLTQS
jgi:tRNA 2-thiocytidine biosynthesis protein TtcA